MIAVINLRWNGPCLCFLIVGSMCGDVVLMQVVLEGSEYITIPKRARILASGTNKSLREGEKGR